MTVHPVRCFYCDKRLRNHKATRDHVQPVCKGGSFAPDNVVWACNRCNQDKGNLTLDEYRVLIAYRMGIVECPELMFPGE